MLVRGLLWFSVVAQIGSVALQSIGNCRSLYREILTIATSGHVKAKMGRITAVV